MADAEQAAQATGRADEIRARHAAATEGPWWVDEDEQCWRLHGVAFRIPADPPLPAQVMNRQILKAPKTGTPYAEYWPDRDDAALIEHAHADIGWLLAALADAQSAIADYENRITWHTTCGQCATTLDRAIADHDRAEQAEADRDEQRARADAAEVERDEARHIARRLAQAVQPLAEGDTRAAVALTAALGPMPDWLTAVQQRPGHAPGECPTPCDDDCDSPCHEGHEVPYKRTHMVPAAVPHHTDTTTSEGN